MNAVHIQGPLEEVFKRDGRWSEKLSRQADEDEIITTTEEHNKLPEHTRASSVMYLYQLDIVVITKALRTTVLGIRNFYQQSSSSICPVCQYFLPDIYNVQSCAISCSILVITTYHARAARYLTCLKIQLGSHATSSPHTNSS